MHLQKKLLLLWMRKYFFHYWLFLKMKVQFENENPFWKWKHNLKMKTHFENLSLSMRCQSSNLLVALSFFITLSICYWPCKSFEYLTDSPDVSPILFKQWKKSFDSSSKWKQTQNICQLKNEHLCLPDRIQSLLSIMG
jgi:hypothetical protein